MKSKEYFNFVVSKIENDLRIYSKSGELLKCLYLLNVLKTSENLLKDIYIISRAENLKNLGNYLLFILKKTETGEIKFDNLLENISLDREFIMGELLSCFNVTDIREQRRETEQHRKKKKEEQAKEDRISSEIKRILAESKFKVEEIDNELVTEEFIESESRENDDSIVRGNYLELLHPESEFEDASVFTLPTGKPGNNTEEEIDIEEADVFSLPGEVPKSENKPEEELVTEQVNIEEIEEIKLGKIAEEPKENVGAAEETEEIAEEEEKLTVATEEAIREEQTEETEKDGLLVNEQEQKEEEEGKILEPKKKIISEETVTEETLEDAGLAETENSIYMKYETELLTSNVLLRNILDELEGLNPEDENYPDRKNVLISGIVESSAYMEEYSRKMSFEVITSIYNIMCMTFSNYGKTVGNEIIALFKNSVNLIESLIKGEDFDGYDNVMKSLDVLKNALLEIKKDEYREEKPPGEKDDLEKQFIPKEYDTNQRQKLAATKQNIIDVENVFKSIEEIKGKFQAYEALRRLSHTFAHFKELVNIANSLDMRKLAQLAEASYIFVKFIQNYRMNPFESEISEVFKYIIYNFKLIFLDKPTKDIDLLISYLNDPVKIFGKKEKQ